MAEVYNILQLARKIGKSTKTVKRWVKKGWLPKPLYTNGWPVWDRSDVEKALADKK
jgi:predicted DNA-binding transcriptional regulator AlpA